MCHCFKPDLHVCSVYHNVPKHFGNIHTHNDTLWNRKKNTSENAQAIYITSKFTALPSVPYFLGWPKPFITSSYSPLVQRMQEQWGNQWVRPQHLQKLRKKTNKTYQSCDLQLDGWSLRKTVVCVLKIFFPIICCWWHLFINTFELAP